VPIKRRRLTKNEWFLWATRNFLQIDDVLQSFLELGLTHKTIVKFSQMIKRLFRVLRNP
jgi:hypothetical protein